MDECKPLLVGGTDVAADVRRFADDGALALIGTPGRACATLTQTQHQRYMSR